MNTAIIKPNYDVNITVTLLRVYTETERYLASLGRAASEGRAIQEASNFNRWLQFSGVLRLLELNSDIDARFVTLRKKADELQFICVPYLQGRNEKLPPSQSRVDEINDKVDFILSIIAKDVTPALPVPLQVTDVGGVIR